MIRAEERKKEKRVEDERKVQRRKGRGESERRGWEMEEIWRGEKRRGESWADFKEKKEIKHRTTPAWAESHWGGRESDRDSIEKT